MAKPEDANFAKVLMGISNDSGRSMMEVFTAFVKCAACAFSLGAREAEYMGEVARWQRPHVEAFSAALGHLTAQMEERRARSGWDDLLGETFEEHLSGGRASQMGQFFTPQDVCRVMADVTLDEATFRQGCVVEVYEPTCGSGRNVLAVWEWMERRRLSALCARATCWDLDPLVADMCVVNLSMHGIPGVVVHGNTLTQEAFKTTFTPFWPLARPMEAQAADPMLEAIRKASALLESTQEPVSTHALEPVVVTLDKRGQYAMDLFQEAA